MNNHDYEALILSKQPTPRQPTPIGEHAMKIVSKLSAMRIADKQAARIIASALPAGLYPARITVVGDCVLIVVQTRADYERFKAILPAMTRAIRNGGCAARAVSIVQEHAE